MCIPPEGYRSVNSENRIVSENRVDTNEPGSISLSNSFTNDTWSLVLNISTRYKFLLSGEIGYSEFRRLLFLVICLVPGTKATRKTSTCPFEVSMWETCCYFCLEECSFDKIDLQLTLHHTNPTCLVGLFESPKYFGEA
jgi:hypothetical protein